MTVVAAMLPCLPRSCYLLLDSCSVAEFAQRAANDPLEVLTEMILGGGPNSRGHISQQHDKVIANSPEGQTSN